MLWPSLDLEGNIPIHVLLRPTSWVTRKLLTLSRAQISPGLSIRYEPQLKQQCYLALVIHPIQ